MTHDILIDSEIEIPELDALSGQIMNYITAALHCENVPVSCEVNVLITDDEGIRTINREYRQIDRATDVLSFPMFDLTPEEFPEDVEPYLDPGSSIFPLGDMALSIERIRAQADEFGHSEERELGYLTVHSVLHLLGYDHMDEGPMKRQMRRHEDAVMDYLGLPARQD